MPEERKDPSQSSAQADASDLAKQVASLKELREEALKSSQKKYQETGEEDSEEMKTFFGASFDLIKKAETSAPEGTQPDPTLLPLIKLAHAIYLLPVKETDFFKSILVLFDKKYKGDLANIEKITEAISLFAMVQALAIKNHDDNKEAKRNGRTFDRSFLENDIPILLRRLEFYLKSKDENIQAEGLDNIIKKAKGFQAILEYEKAVNEIADKDSMLFKRGQDNLKQYHQALILSNKNQNNAFYDDIRPLVETSTNIMNELNSLKKMLDRKMLDSEKEAISITSLELGSYKEMADSYASVLMVSNLGFPNKQALDKASQSISKRKKGIEALIAYEKALRKNNTILKANGLTIEISDLIEKQHHTLNGILISSEASNVYEMGINAFLSSIKQATTLFESFNIFCGELSKIQETRPSSTSKDPNEKSIYDLILAHNVKMIKEAMKSGNFDPAQRKLTQHRQLAQALLEYEKALYSITDTSSPIFKNRQLLLKKQQEQLNKLLGENADLTDFIALVNQEKSALLQLKMLDSAVRNPKNRDPEVKKKGQNAYKSCDDKLYDELKKTSAKIEDIQFIENDCIKNAIGAIENQGTEKARLFITGLLQAAEKAISKTSFGRKMAGPLIALGVALGISGMRWKQSETLHELGTLSETKLPGYQPKKTFWDSFRRASEESPEKKLAIIPHIYHSPLKMRKLLQ